MCEPCIHGEGECENHFLPGWSNVSLMNAEKRVEAGSQQEHEEEEDDLAGSSSQEALKSLIQPSVIVALRPVEETTDFYLLSASTPVYTTAAEETDAFGHTCEAGISVFRGHSLGVGSSATYDILCGHKKGSDCSNISCSFSMSTTV